MGVGPSFHNVIFMELVEKVNPPSAGIPVSFLISHQAKPLPILLMRKVEVGGGLSFRLV